MAFDTVADRPQRPLHGHRWRIPWATVLPIAVYAVLGLAAYYPTWPGDPSRIVSCSCSDAGLNTWFLAWTAHAVAHGHNPFFTTALNHPAGVNLTYNTQMPLLGLLTTPLTLTAGPVASLNLLMWFAFPLSATSMFLVLRRWTSWAPAAFVGGLLYAFSPYMFGQSTGHLHLTFIPLPPLILLAVVELFVHRSGSPTRWGVALGLLAAGQFFISSEILTTTGLVTVIGLVVLAIARPHEVLGSLRFASQGLVWASIIFAALIAYPAWMFFAGPLHYDAASKAAQTSPLSADLLGPFVPTSLERFTPVRWATVGNNFIPFGDYTENGSYLGVPLVLLLVYATIRFWRNRWIRFTALMVMVTFVLSLGSTLVVDGRRTGVPLPYALIQHVPIVENLMPSRISMLTALFAGVLLALGLDQLHATLRSGRRSASGGERSGGGGVSTVADQATSSRNAPRKPVKIATGEWVAFAAVAVLAIVSLVPSWPNRTVPTGTPSYFTSRDVDRISPGTVTLTYPYAMSTHAQPMVWQSVTGMRFTLIGGYALIPNSNGVPSLFPSQLDPPTVQEFLVNEEGGVPFYLSPSVPDNSTLVGDVRQFVARYGVGAVLVATSEQNSAQVSRLITEALGTPPTVSGGIAAWYHVQHDPGLHPPG